jgi:hypothetical protein
MVIPERAAYAFQRACDVGFATGCANRARPPADPPSRAAASVEDYRILLSEGKAPLLDLAPLDLYSRACAQGFPDGCERACEAGDREACSTAGERRSGE